MPQPKAKADPAPAGRTVRLSVSVTVERDDEIKAIVARRDSERKRRGDGAYTKTDFINDLLDEFFAKQRK